MRYLLLLALLGFSSAHAQQKPESRFWGVVAPKLGSSGPLKSGPSPLFDQISVELSKVDTKLAFEVGQARDSIKELIISADGLSELIPQVKALVAAAPQIQGWRVVAFRQRGRPGSSITYDDLTMAADSVWFRRESGALPVDITIYARGVEGPRKNQAIGAVFLLLDDAIGEYDAMVNLGGIGFHEPPRDYHGLRPLAQLAPVVDSLKAK